MGFSRTRVDKNKNGKIRYTALYPHLRGSIRSAGTFTTEKASDRAWQKAEVELRQGRVGDRARGRPQTESGMPRTHPPIAGGCSA